MTQGLPISDAVSPGSHLLAMRARAKRLTIYAGAGISRAAPTSLPGAAGLAEALQSELSGTVSFDGIPVSDLVKTADRVAAQPQGTALLHSAILKVGGFQQAPFGMAHSVLAILVAEGAATVITTNYDDCIERATIERIPVVVDDSDRAALSKIALLKVHGCATRPATLLATTAELSNPPMYATAEVRARLTTDDFAFVGLGSPADYVKSSLEHLLASVGTASLTIVDPSMATWESTEWRNVLPSLSDDRRLDSDANVFCDDLLRAYLQSFFRELEARASHLPPEHPQRAGLSVALKLMRARTSIWMMNWLRSALVGDLVGKQVVASPSAIRLLLAIGYLSSQTAFEPRPKGLAIANGAKPRYLMALGSDESPIGAQMAAEVRRRIQVARSDYAIPEDATVLAVCAGHLGTLTMDELIGTTAFDGNSLENDSFSDDLIDGAGRAGHLVDGDQGRIVFINAERLVVLT